MDTRKKAITCSDPDFWSAGLLLFWTPSYPTNIPQHDVQVRSTVISTI